MSPLAHASIACFAVVYSLFVVGCLVGRQQDVTDLVTGVVSDVGGAGRQLEQIYNDQRTGGSLAFESAAVTQTGRAPGGNDSSRQRLTLTLYNDKTNVWQNQTNKTKQL